MSEDERVFMETVFVLQHSHEQGSRDEAKLIGVYATAADAEAAVARLKAQPGFREHPDGFYIDPYELGQDHWQEGFVSIVTIMVPLLDEGTTVWRPVHAQPLSGGTFRIISANDHADERWAFNAGQVVACEERHFNGGSQLVAVSLVPEASTKELSNTA